MCVCHSLSLLREKAFGEGKKRWKGTWRSITLLALSKLCVVLFFEITGDGEDTIPKRWEPGSLKEKDK